jgi:hypothetical protein
MDPLGTMPRFRCFIASTCACSAAAVSNVLLLKLLPCPFTSARHAVTSCPATPSALQCPSGCNVQTHGLCKADGREWQEAWAQLVTLCMDEVQGQGNSSSTLCTRTNGLQLSLPLSGTHVTASACSAGLVHSPSTTPAAAAAVLLHESSLTDKR